ncbi:uncharacterized protein YecT (DUF1311 family) [Paraburkholderia sp. GAS199]|uniref:lysozyme inhibitor LprI family protein n=1 Tax=Paraburkholderia sp. GAS199 TaxID=3035126 RepID=UPI003D2378DC
MKNNKFLLLIFALLVAIVAIHSPHAYAENRYLMTGAAQFPDSSSTDAHALPFPVNPVNSAALTFDGKAVAFHYEGDNCSVNVEKKMAFYFDPVISNAFGSRDQFGHYLVDKFHTNSTALNETYLLGESHVSLCSGLRHAMVYQSPDSLIFLTGAWMYIFQRETHAPVDAEQSFDCAKAQSNVEHLICADANLVKLDATVNRGFVAMQLVHSREISFQDPVRVDQINWLKTVRNTCSNKTCLLTAYQSRIAYIKANISSAYPSYPAVEPDQDGD